MSTTTVERVPHLVATGAGAPIEDDGPGRGAGVTARRVLWFVVVRLASAAFVLWAAITITFVAVQAMPGDTVDLLLGNNRDDPVLRAAVIARWQLDRPVLFQYLSYLARVPRGDLGVSYDLNTPVATLIGESIGSTLQLALAAGIASLLVAYGLALLTSGRLRFLRPVSSFVELVLVSAPPFWIGIVLLLVFSFQLGWFSVIDARSAQALVLPTAAIALPIGSYLAQVLRTGADRAMEQPLAVTARARGLSLGGVYRRHALRHGSIPVLTVLGLVVGSLLGGAVITETVFGRAGLGQLAVNAVTVKDVPLILGVALVTTFAFVVSTTVVDVVALAVDPRLRTDAAR